MVAFTEKRNNVIKNIQKANGNLPSFVKRSFIPILQKSFYTTSSISYWLADCPNNDFTRKTSY